jgi:hypothetical protein
MSFFRYYQALQVLFHRVCLVMSVIPDPALTVAKLAAAFGQEQVRSATSPSQSKGWCSRFTGPPLDEPSVELKNSVFLVAC